MIHNSVEDEYCFWKNLIEKKQDAGEVVPATMFELMAMAEIKMLQVLQEKHYSSGDKESPICLH